MMTGGWCTTHRVEQRTYGHKKRSDNRTIGRSRKNEASRLAAVEAVNSDGRWDRAHAGPITITVFDDFA